MPEIIDAGIPAHRFGFTVFFRDGTVEPSRSDLWTALKVLRLVRREQCASVTHIIDFETGALLTERDLQRMVLVRSRGTGECAQVEL